MKAELSRIILFVDDVAAMTAFYRDALGLTPLDGATDGWACLAAGDGEVCLHAIPAQYREENPDYAKREDSYVKFAFRSADVEKDRDELVAKGARMNEIVRFGELTFCDGADPEGNIFQICSR